MNPAWVEKFACLRKRLCVRVKNNSAFASGVERGHLGLLLALNGCLSHGLARILERHVRNSDPNYAHAGFCRNALAEAPSSPQDLLHLPPKICCWLDRTK